MRNTFFYLEIFKYNIWGNKKFIILYHTQKASESTDIFILYNNPHRNKLSWKTPWGSLFNLNFFHGCILVFGFRQMCSVMDECVESSVGNSPRHVQLSPSRRNMLRANIFRQGQISLVQLFAQPVSDPQKLRRDSRRCKAVALWRSSTALLRTMNS